MSSEHVERRIFSDDMGDAEMVIYHVFPGVQLVYNSVHMDRFDVGFAARGNLIEILHCREGRIEQEFEDEVFYLMPGDLSIAVRSEEVKDFSFPLRHYHGITIIIDIDTAPACFSEFLDDVRVQPLEVARRLCGERNSRVLRAQPYIEHIFSELYSVPENIRMGYLKVKILELLLILSGAAPKDNPAPVCTLTKLQVQLAKQAADYLAQHMERRITILELARQFNVSDTHLKTAFKGVYGMPVFSFVRLQKMQLAAQRLIHTDLPVADIAAEVGYSNSGKFSAAFRDLMGETPGEYRRAHSKRPAVTD